MAAGIGIAGALAIGGLAIQGVQTLFNIGKGRKIKKQIKAMNQQMQAQVMAQGAQLQQQMQSMGIVSGNYLSGNGISGAGGQGANLPGFAQF